MLACDRSWIAGRQELKTQPVAMRMRMLLSKPRALLAQQYAVAGFFLAVSMDPACNAVLA